jgi:hypothetical protein
LFKAVRARALDQLDSLKGAMKSHAAGRSRAQRRVLAEYLSGKQLGSKRFTGTLSVWGEQAKPKDTVIVAMWDGYLEPACRHGAFRIDAASASR